MKEATTMSGLDPDTPEEYQRRAEESEKNLEMTLTGAGMVLLSIIFGILNLITGGVVNRKREQREALLERDMETASQGKAESRRLAREFRGQPNRPAQLLEVYKQHSTTEDKIWMQGFWAGIPNTIKRYIEDQYEQHPEWLEGTETGWF